MIESRFVRAVNRVHLLYLGLLPALGTFALLYRYGYPWPFLLFVVGVALTGVYLASVYHYTHLPPSVLGSLWALLDGPLFALASRRGQVIALSFAMEAFLVDGLALWLAILGLALVSRKPSPAQRVASLGISCAVLGVALSLFWPYADQALGGRWSSLGWIAAGVVEGALVRYRLLKAEATTRLGEDASILYVALLVMAWVVAMNVGLALYDSTPETGAWSTGLSCYL